MRLDLTALFGTGRPLIGMVHLRALPGAPAHRSMRDVLEAARRDAAALAEGGCNAIMVENFGDAPFFPGSVPPETVAGITVAAAAVREAVSLPLGINVLRNDAPAALGIAVATGAAFIRVNVLTGGMYTDQGWIEGRAHEVLRSRAALRADVAILADVLVKHAAPPPGTHAAAAARDLWHRGGADALIVTGAATGEAVDVARLEAVRRAVPDAPILAGSGVTAANAAEVLRHANGAIVGSAVQREGRAGAGVEVERVRAVVAAFRRASA